MRLALGAALAALAMASGFAGVGRGAPAGTAATECSRASALRVGKPFFFDPLSTNPIAQVLCGPFAGAGSEAMAVSFTAPTCWGIQRWVVFRFSAGDWHVVLDRRGFFFKLVGVGADIRETVPVFRAGDGRCNPTGGSRARLWHWGGTRFVAGPWTIAAPARPAATTGYFKTPSGNIVCYHSGGPSDRREAVVACGIKSGLKPAPPRHACSEGGYAGDRVYLTATGRTSVPSCAGDPGALVGEKEARVLGYGKSWSGGGLRCTSAMAGLTCRNTTGHGFFLSRASWRVF